VATLLNVVNPSNTGATYWAHIPGSEVVFSNNSPKFTSEPPFYFCTNVNNTIDHSATDADGDSLAYFLTAPFNGLDACCPMIEQFLTSTNSPGCPMPSVNCPTVNTAPPYLNLAYTSGYNSNYPVSSSPAMAINNAGLITLTSTPSVFTSYSRFTIADKIGGANPLPIELIYFSATKNNKQVNVNWETASELNNDYYLVEKSKDGVSFESFAKVAAAGNSLSKLKYATIDGNPFSGVSYYRLRQVDFNGAYSYSQIQAVEFDDSKEFSFDVFPNPNEGKNINITLNANQDDEVLVVVYDITGQESYSKVLITSEDDNSVFAIDPSNSLAPGVYLITATSKQTIYSKRLIVK
jgi:hypothetical protein